MRTFNGTRSINLMGRKEAKDEPLSDNEVRKFSRVSKSNFIKMNKNSVMSCL